MPKVQRVVHLLHFHDSMPLCWTLAEVDQRDAHEVVGSFKENEVTCCECLDFLETVDVYQ